jgi:photosystem II stability/assembly factor-like uncharacterized protein
MTHNLFFITRNPKIMMVSLSGDFMKQAIATLVFAGCISSAVQAQTAWTWQNPLPQGNDLTDVQAIDANTAVAVGFGGTFLKTTDAGAAWNSFPVTAGSIPKRITRTLRSVHFADKQNGCIVGDNNTFLKTTDGGASWTAFEIPFIFDPMNPFRLPDMYSMSAVHFIDGQTGWAAGDKQVLDAMTMKTVGAVMKTSNGGATWSDCSPQTEHRLNSVFFTDAQNGYTAGGKFNAAVILKTTDGGKTWTPCPNMPVYKDQSIALEALYFTDAQKGWAVGGMDLAIKTTDGGNTWEKTDWSALKYFLQPTDVFFATSLTGWIIGSALVKTTDGGATWVEQQAGRAGNAIHFSGVVDGWMAGDSGLLLHSADGGKAWNAQSSAASTSTIYGLYFPQPALGWAAGTGGTLLKTTDGGNRWQAKTVPESVDFLSVHFFDATTGWLAGGGYAKSGTWSGQVQKTTTGGESWSVVYAAPGKTLTDLFFTDSQTGWIIGESALLRKTTDGGTSWTDQPNPLTGTTQRLESVHFVDKNNGWVAAGYSGKILNTTNGGANWAEQTSGTSEWLYSVHFINASTGWAAGGSALLKTTNGGTTWLKQTLPSGVTSLRAVHFYDASNGFAAGGTGGSSIAIRSTDGGVSWTVEETGFSMQFNAVYAAGPGLGWVAGQNGAIIRYGQPAANLPPVFVSASTVQVIEKSAFIYTAHATDPEGAPLTYSFSNYPAWMTPGDSTLSGTAPAGEGAASFTVTASDGIGASVLNVSVTILKGTGVGTESEYTVPNAYSLFQAYPNPFNPSTSVAFTLPERAEVALRIFDVRGNRVKTVFRGGKEAGKHKAFWDGKDESDRSMPSGVYFFQMTAGPYRSIQKMMMIR